MSLIVIVIVVLFFLIKSFTIDLISFFSFFYSSFQDELVNWQLVESLVVVVIKEDVSVELFVSVLGEKTVIGEEKIVMEEGSRLCWS